MRTTPDEAIQKPNVTTGEFMSYYETPEDFYEVFANERDAEDEMSELEYAREKMQVVLDSLYGDKPLNDMEDAVFEVCGALDLPTPFKKELNVQKKSNEYFELGKYLIENQAKI